MERLVNHHDENIAPIKLSGSFKQHDLPQTQREVLDKMRIHHFLIVISLTQRRERERTGIMLGCPYLQPLGCPPRTNSRPAEKPFPELVCMLQASVTSTPLKSNTLSCWHWAAGINQPKTEALTQSLSNQTTKIHTNRPLSHWHVIANKQIFKTSTDVFRTERDADERG